MNGVNGDVKYEIKIQIFKLKFGNKVNKQSVCLSEQHFVPLAMKLKVFQVGQVVAYWPHHSKLWLGLDVFQ